MSDLIDRQAAIDTARNWYEGLICGSFKGLEKRLRVLPSAQPEIIRCKDCKYHGANECNHSFALVVSKDNDFCSYAERRIDE